MSGIRVLDLALHGALDCGRILASFGAEVAHIDTPDALAHIEAHPWRALCWRAGNIGKQCSTIDYQCDDGLRKMRALLAEADILIETFNPSVRAALGLNYEDLAAAHPRLVVVSISTFGTIGPRAAWAGGELIAQAMSGVLRTCGDADRPPVREPLQAAYFAAAAAGAFGAIVALHHRRRCGKGQHVDIAAQEVAASRNLVPLIRYQFDQLETARRGGSYGTRSGARAIWKLKDGFAFFTLMAGQFGAPANRALSAWMDDLHYPNPMTAIDWNSYRPGTPDNEAAWEFAIDKFFSDRTRAELTLEGRARGLTATALLEPREVPTHPQLAARDFFDPQGVPHQFVRTAAGLGVMDPLICRPQQHHSSDAALPLSGLKVLDFSWAIVGGTASKLLGDLGAEIIKIESAKRMGLERIVVDVSVSRPDNPDDKPWFAHVSTSKQSMLLDLKHPGARPVLDALIARADVVLENFSPGTMEKLGLGFPQLCAIKPSIIMASGSVYGQTGPLRENWGIDGTGAALSGRTFAHGWPDRSPVLPAAPYGDCVVPYFLSAAIIAAVERRDATGRGMHIDASMFEILAQQMLPLILEEPARERHAARRGNYEPDVAPHGVYPCRGADTWIAIAAYDDSQWRQLCVVLQLPHLASDAQFARAALRKQNETFIDMKLASATGNRDAQELMHALQSCGVPAGVVQSAGELLDHDPQFKVRQVYQLVDHPLLGAFAHQRIPVGFSCTPSRMTPAPRLGQHTRQIFCGLPGMDEVAYQAALAGGVFR